MVTVPEVGCVRVSGGHCVKKSAHMRGRERETERERERERERREGLTTSHNISMYVPHMQYMLSYYIYDIILMCLPRTVLTMAVTKCTEVLWQYRYLHALQTSLLLVSSFSAKSLNVFLLTSFCAMWNVSSGGGICWRVLFHSSS